MTLSFHKVQFDAQEVLDMAAEAETLLDFRNTFCDLAEERSRLDTRLGDECPACGDTYHNLPRHHELNYKGCADTGSWEHNQAGDPYSMHWKPATTPPDPPEPPESIQDHPGPPETAQD
jgi:hypothetical protein